MDAKTNGMTSTTLGLMKYVHVMFFAGAVIAAWLLAKIVDTVWTSLNLAFVWVPPPSNWGGIIVGGVGAAGLAYYMWRHPKINRLAVEIIAELSKVTWPTRKELSASTVVVIILSIIAAIILGLFDFFWAWVTDLIYT